ncbi:ABC transporter permease [Pseudaminobacter sp. 19-2017]|uniref:ABC transporter permease n=1 Tax=Pseudaminobacter soli (ex Zhang et al. 2022) TaxID=2831468 RepID=A0A942E3P5_9HYPH|nr:ABC transporter permease [Pseudaminobacter soli]MBS3652417.1 ABC transporter permease [Pseudaminobacter soli]
MDMSYMVDVFLELLSGVPLTIQLVATSTAAGMILGLLLAFMRMSSSAAVRLFAQTYIFVFRGTPLLVQIFLIYYGLGQFHHTLQDIGLWWFFREPYWCAILALTLNTTAYTGEIFRGGLQSVPFPMIEAGRAFGMSRFVLFRRIVFPIALRQALPAYSNEIILMIKATSLASIVTMMEITGLAYKLISETFRAVEVFVCAAAIYLVLTFVITRVVQGLEWWLSPHLRRDPKWMMRRDGDRHYAKSQAASSGGL